MTKGMKTASLPSVLAFERKIAPSDGIMFGTDWEKRSMVSDSDVLKLVEKSVRGTISNRLKAGADFEKEVKKAESANLQRIDACALNEQDDTLVLKFTVKFFGGLKKPSACNSQSFLETYQSALNAFTDGIGFAELAKRYALNLANARFLWRNRVGASQIEVKVKAKSASFELSECEWTFDALGFDLRNFSSDNKEISSLAALIAQALSSDDGFLLLEVSAAAQIGFGQEVYPSQELVLDSGKTDRSAKSRILYQVNQSAAMHSQKIGNAIRTVDTWYPEAENFGNAPIAAEPYGSVTSLGKAFRTPATKQDFYSLFDAWAMGGSLNEDEANYVVAVLIKGGVFGKGDNA
jgi:CRISPR-associated protein Csy3